MALPTPEELAEMDQGLKMITESFPGLWWGLYEGCLNQGFNAEQALELVKEYIHKP